MLKLHNKAQAAMEFLLNYGWAIMVVVIVISASAYFGFLSPSNFAPERCAVTLPFNCDGGTAGEDVAGIALENVGGRDLTVKSVTFTSEALLGECTANVNIQIKNGEEQTIYADDPVGCSHVGGKGKNKYAVKITYFYAGSGIDQQMVGEMVAKFGGAVSGGVGGGVTGAVAHWAFDDLDKGTQVIDYSGNGNDGTFVGAVYGGTVQGAAAVPGKYGDALSFDGADDYASTADANSLDMGTGDFTVEAWVNKDSDGYNVIANKRKHNYAKRSEAFDDAVVWINYCNLGTMTANDPAVAAPDGTFTAEKLVAGGANCAGTTGRIQTISLTAGQTYTVSIWARRLSGGTDFKLGFNDGNTCGLTLTDSWTRYTCTKTISGDTSRGMQWYTGGGNTVYVWGAQFERSPKATVYAKTDGTAFTDSGYSLWLEDSRVKAAASSTANTKAVTVEYDGVGAGWHHVAVVFNRGSNLQLYLDGAEAAAASLADVSGQDISNANSLTIGGTGTEIINAFDGLADEVRIYKKALTPAEITESMNSRYPVKGAAASYSFENPSSRGSDTHFIVQGQKGGALHLDGVSESVLCGNPLTTELQFSVSAWFNTDDAAAAEDHIVDLGDDGFNPRNFLVWRGSLVNWFAADAENDLLSVPGTAGNAPLGLWNHAVITRNGDTANLYVNGNPDSSNTNAAAGNVIGTSQCEIGSNADDDRWFDGLIDDVVIYDRALTDAEAQALGS
ncbi:LamG domain-containing protein [Candidatus Woesearchaeota archaeon]|nr:LamG domain-containing protein [Candidatus Woesearchaeota archaeon]